MRKRYLNNLDYLKGLAIIGVVAIHTLGTEYPLNNDFLYIMYINTINLSAFSVPFFIFISGLVLTYNYGDIKMNYKEFIMKRLLAILIPYIIWSFLYITYNRVEIGKTFDINPIAIIRKLITGNAEFHLYFIVLIIQFYLIFPFILKYFLKFKKYHTNLLSLIFFFNLLIIFAYYYQFDYLSEKILKKVFIFWIFYFVYGMITGYNIDNNKYQISDKSLKYFVFLFLIAFVSLDISYFSNGLQDKNIFWLRPQTLIYATLSIIIAFKLSNELRITDNLKLPAQLLKKFGQNSFGIYLSHALFLSISLRSFDMLHIDNRSFYYNFLLFTVVLITSLIFVIIISRLPSGRFLVGNTYRKNINP